MSTKSLDAKGVRRPRKLRWRRPKKTLAATDKTKDATPLHALVEPADLTLVGGTKRAGRFDILT
jgi:hypothetical protein